MRRMHGAIDSHAVVTHGGRLSVSRHGVFWWGGGPVLKKVAVTTVTAAALGAFAATAFLLAPESRLPGGPSLSQSTTETAAVALAPPGAAGPAPVSAPVAALEHDSAPAPVLADGWGDTEPALEPVERRTIALGRGGTLIQLLMDADVPRESAHLAVDAMRKIHNPRQLRQGQEVAVLFDRSEGAPRFVGFEFQPSVEKVVSVTADDGRFTATETEKPLIRADMAVRGTIRSSLYQSAAEAGVPAPVIAALIRTYSYDVDFQRDLQEGDGFEVMFERLVTETGAVAREGVVRYASLTLGGKKLPIYRHELPDGTVDYFNNRGESVRKALLRTPIDGARISSGFGMRRHPVLGYSKMHKGVDFAAPTGTPIFAAGDGVVEEAGAKGAYGNYIRVRHNGKIQTAYAHLSRFGKNIRRGARVAQGDVIGYVGSTGRSTGPHLHFEVMENGRQVNPQKADMPSGRTLDGKELKQFQALMAAMDAEFEQRLTGDAMADSTGAAGLSLVSSPARPR
ncbi:MAG: hypothetical protein RLY86_4112 [Pseudomonadota bacterium]|jgi:murein DD-endopeptidase MepM/ murein hydrolase activator NlpD